MEVTKRRELFIESGRLLYGDQWQRAIARGLGPLHPDGERESIDDRLVRRWAAGERDVPDWVLPAVVEIAEARRRQLGLLVTMLRKACPPA